MEEIVYIFNVLATFTQANRQNREIRLKPQMPKELTLSLCFPSVGC